MRQLEQWIWLPENSYPQCQTTPPERSVENYKRNYRVCEFKKEVCYNKKIDRIELRFSGDTSVALYCGKNFVGRAPASSGGDFLVPQLPHSVYYATKVTLASDDYPEFSQGKLNFYAVVRMAEARLFEFSGGHGGFFLTAHIYFDDNSKALLITDESWQTRYMPEYEEIGIYNKKITCEPWVNARRIQNIWHCETAPIPPCAEKYIKLGEMEIAPSQNDEKSFPLDKIYAGYPVIKATGKLQISLMCREYQEEGSIINCNFENGGIYECKELHSAGELLIKAENQGNASAKAEIGFIKSHYPVTEIAKTTTSNEKLNKVLDTCIHTLKYCRQTLHLDSPRHCELLACTGDYYIESLMTAFSFGDQALSKFDIRRTAELLRHRDGEMFHTTYSLIWVQMLWDIYLFTGDKTLLEDCEDALELLLRRFSTYIGETGLIETPPSFMFIDWLNPDGISMHHPPKALGQTCLNMFYYGALKTSVKIYTELGRPVKDIEAKISLLHKAIYDNLYDKERGLFFEGLNTPTPENMLHDNMPQNISKRYYMKHSNILAAYFGFFSKEECANLLCRIIPDEALGNVQPYFCHFLLEAVYRNDLREKFTLNIIEKWIAPVEECSKGLVEGFYKPEPSYSFDHSHAWGGTPAWSLPLALTGLKITEPGMKKLQFNPSLLGLSFAEVQIPTPYGMITVKQNKESAPVIDAPNCINIEII